MSRRSWFAVLVLGAAVLSVPAGPVSAAVPVAATTTEPAYSYADAIRESVWVPIGLDSDQDGQPDRIAVDLVRPREAAAAGVKVPVIMEASPYYSCCGRGTFDEKKAYDSNGTITSMPLFYDNYFVPRGYAFVAVDLVGTGRSMGCDDLGGPVEVRSATAVIDWLNGRARAYHADGSPAVADWTTGRVGMIGKSWDGTTANAVAATGVSGLATVVSISAISSWYDYMRYNGVIRTLGFPASLVEDVSGRPASACSAVTEQLRTMTGEATGDLTPFWAERDYRPSVGQVRASVFLVHGGTDTNVTTSQFALWWQELGRHDVSRKLWLSQPGHVDPFDFRRAQWVDTLHRWFDHYLYGLDNGIEAEPQAAVETHPGTWRDEASWPVAGAHPVQARLGAGAAGTGTLGGPAAPAGTIRTYRDNTSLTEPIATANPNQDVNGRLVFLSAPLATDLRLSGIASTTLRVRVNRPTTELTVRLVDYGIGERIDRRYSEGVHLLSTQSCWGDSTPADRACYQDAAESLATTDLEVISRGWQDAAHGQSLQVGTPLQPNTWYTITVPMQATDTLLRAGHVLGLVLQQSDPGYTGSADPGDPPLPSATDATVELDLHDSWVTLPQVGPAGLPAVGSPPRLSTVGAGADANPPPHRLPPS